jgi:hypothetical protein
MAKKVYINVPGGAILNMADGESVVHAYGQEVDVEAVTDGQREHLPAITTTRRPTGEVPGPQEAQLAAALADAGQINSTSSPIPGNYGELTEDQAVRFIQSVDDASSQSVIIAFEIGNLNRQKVIDAAPRAAREEAEVRALIAEHEAGIALERPQPDLSGTPRGGDEDDVQPDVQPDPDAPVEQPDGDTPPPTS